MKVYIKNKVWDIPVATMERKRTITEYKCISGDEVTPVQDYKMDFNVPLDCCTVKLHRYLLKKNRKAKIVKMVVLIGELQEIYLEGYIIPNPYNTIGFTLEGVGEPVFKELIDWGRVENDN